MSITEPTVMLNIEILRCPHGTLAVVIASPMDTGGTRITGRKCCGRWTAIFWSQTTAADLRKVIAEHEEKAAREVEQEARDAEVLDPSKVSIEEVDAELRAAGGDPDAMRDRGRKVVEKALAKRRKAAS